MSHRTIRTADAPTPKRHFSQASCFGQLVFTSGQGPINPATGTIDTFDIAAQTRQTFANLGAILAAAGSSFSQVLKVNVYLRRMEDIAAVDDVFREAFPSDPPPRTTVGTMLGSAGRADRPGMDIEIDVIAYVDEAAR